jgi:hypothetical protein
MVPADTAGIVIDIKSIVVSIRSGKLSGEMSKMNMNPDSVQIAEIR